MKKIIWVFTLLLIFIGSSSFDHEKSWNAFETADVRLMFPGEVSTESNVVDSDVGKLEMKLTMYDASQDKEADNLVYGFFSTTYPDTAIHSDKKETLPRFFRGAIDGAVKNVKGKLLAEKEISIGKYPGREIKVDLNEGEAIIRMRCYLVRNVMYIVQVITLTQKEGNASIGKFFDSFSLKV
jgi:hypothetical protein